MTGYRIPWRKIEDGCAWPDEEEIVLVSTENGTTGDWLQKGRWHWASIYGVTVFAWAPLPAPYDPDAEPVDEIAALKARCERLAEVVRAVFYRLQSEERDDAVKRAISYGGWGEAPPERRWQFIDDVRAIYGVPIYPGDLEVSE